MARGRAGRGRIISPATTATTIVFPFNPKTYTYNTNHYMPSMTNGLVSTEEINQFFTEMQVPITEYNKQEILNKWWLPLVLFLCPPVLIGFLFYIACCYDGAKREDEAKQKAISYIKEKAPSYKQRGFTWVASPIFPKWIELWTVEPPAFIQMYNTANTEKVNFGQADMNMQNMMMMQQQQMNTMPNQQGYALNQQSNPNMTTNQQNQFNNNMYNGGTYNNNNGLAA